MSQRSIVEINHDYAHKITADDTRMMFTRLLERALASGSDESWEPLSRFGITRITQCHHSERRKAVVGGREYPFG